MMTDLDQRDLVNAARAGDKSAMSALLKQVQSPVYRFGLKMCGDPADAEDVLQDTMLAMAQTIGDFRGASSVTTWLYTVARRFCIKKRRKSKFAPKHVESLDKIGGVTTESLADQGDTPEDTAAHRQLLSALQGVLDTLDPDQREVMVLRDVEGLSATEVAEILDVSVAAIKSRLHRARATVRERAAKLLDVAQTTHASAENCPDIVELFSRHLEEDLSSETCAQMERHLDGCGPCRGACDFLKQMLMLCRDGGESQVPASLQESLHKAIEQFLSDR